MTITIEECEARVWSDSALIQEAINDHGDIFYWLKEIRTDKDEMSRNERAWSLVEEAVHYRALSMKEELDRRYDDSADQRLDDPRHGQAAAITRRFA